MTTKLSERLREAQQFTPANSTQDLILKDCIAQSEAREQECEAMCGDHGGIEGCSCSECSTPLGPRELCAYCNGCGRRVKWPMADGTEYRAPVKEAQSGDLSDDWDEFKLQTVLTNCQQQSSSEFHRETGAEMLIWLRDHGYLRPSQAIGDPVRWMNEHGTVYGYPHKSATIPLYRSPMSSEARDKAIAMFEKIWLNATSHGRQEPYASQAEAGLSALRQ